jgi:GTP-binding protein EngB required for normal cell division
LCVCFLLINIIGRSNVGKSSLLNKIFQNNFAHVSSKPGSTRKLYFHYIPKMQGYVIDAPGYGIIKNYLLSMMRLFISEHRGCEKMVGYA